MKVARLFESPQWTSSTSGGGVVINKEGDYDYYVKDIDISASIMNQYIEECRNAVSLYDSR